MSSVYPLHQTFEAGLITPRLQGKAQTEFYQSALSECTNWQLTPQGSIRLRTGSQLLVHDVKENTRILNFTRANRKDVMVVIDDENIKLFNQDGTQVIQNVSDNNFLIDPTFLEGWKRWSYGSDYQSDNPYVNGGVFEPTINAGEGVELQVFNRRSEGSDGFPFVPSYTYELNSHFITQQFKVADTGADANVKVDFRITELLIAFQLNSTSEKMTYRVSITDLNDNTVKEETVDIVASDTIKSVVGYVESFNFVFTPTPAEINYKIKIEVLQNNFTQILQGGFFPNQNKVIVENIAVFEVGAGNTPAEFTSPYPLGTDLKLIQVASDTGRQSLYLVHPAVRPQVIIEDVAGAYSLQSLQFGLADDQKPASWSDTPKPNWPSVVEVAQGRLWLANTPSDPSTIWASKVNDFAFFPAAPASKADDPLEFALNTNGVIEWIRGNKVLLIGTDNSEWIGTSSNGVITWNDFQFIEQSRLGSVGDISPQYVSDQVAYVGLDSRRVRVISFDGDQTNTWASEEISLQIDGFLEGRILDMSYARDPAYQLAIVTGDGIMYVCMRDRFTNLNGWYRYQTTGKFLSVEYSNDPTGSSLWARVERTKDDGSSVYSIERLDAGEETGIHLDGYLTSRITVVADQAGVGAFNSAFSSSFDGQGFQAQYISGLDDYEGQKLGCVLEVSDSNTLSGKRYLNHPDVYVYNGQARVNSPNAGARVFVGFKYIATATTLPYEMGNKLGTGQGTKRHLNRIFVRLINESAYPLLNGYRPIPENPEDNPLDTIVSDDVEVRNEGTLERGIVTIIQDLPIRTEIAALFGKAKVEVT